MKRANQAFQKRINIENGVVEETRVVYNIPDTHPNLTNIIKRKI